MDNLKLITRIAEIEGLEFTVDNGVVYTKQLNDKYDNNIPMPYDPLDDGVNHRLIIKYKLDIEYVIDTWRAWLPCHSGFEMDDNLNLAVLLAIEAAHSN